MKHRLHYIQPTRRERHNAWVLLLVYVSMVLLSSVHIHSAQDYSQLVECGMCQASEHHQGHITSSPHHHGECLSCRFLTTQLIQPDDVGQRYDSECVGEIIVSPSTAPVLRAVVFTLLRAPPFVL